LLQSVMSKAAFGCNKRRMALGELDGMEIRYGRWSR
jgi:hypothetical protein